ncbi:DUF2382 domain-containing protein [Paracoccus subflavus]|uniref:DUF2382 domain-containing protein n=1 Tax=Paracoccus subflavus TaxID=2528244 RepID=A0A4Q9G1B4_9RHOB|nr:YsnF/AvaK domain-containing protein [Paracoccus subflavus]TBN41074.1 DUF2382 domain-containing protein [Paracoccus subflavus]
MTYDNDAGASGNRSVSAMFDSQADAQRAVDRLVEAGIPTGRIRQVAGEAGSTATRVDDQDKGFWDGLADFFFPDEDRYTYAEGLSRGGCLVTVTGLSGSEYETALDILDDEGSIDLNEREANWRSEGWGGYEASSYATGTGTPRGAVAGGYDDMATMRRDALRDNDVTGNDESIPVVEESLRVGKRETGHGRVRVRAYTVEEPVSETVDLREQHVEIERRPVDRAVSAADAFQDRTIEAEEYREEAVVQKEARVVEEIGLRKTTDTRRETVTDTVRHTEVEIEKDGDMDRDGVEGGVRRDMDRDRI